MATPETAVAAEDAPVATEPFPWEAGKREPTIVSSLHILAHEPAIEFRPQTYPSLVIRDAEGYDRSSSARFDLTLTGTAEQRQAFAASLHAVAARIAAWTEADGTAVPE